jgi:hypothetical protein
MEQIAIERLTKEVKVSISHNNRIGKQTDQV